MAIAFRAAGTLVNGINSITPTIGAAQVVGDMTICIGGGKPFNLGWSVTGWTSMGRGESGTTAAGVDAGSMVIQCWYQEAIADPQTDPTITEGSPTFDVAMGSCLTFSKGAGEVWSVPTVVYGADESDGTSVSATMSADNNVAAGDFVILIVVANSDLMGPFTTDAAVSQTGVTFGTMTARNDGEATAGGDMSFHTVTGSVTAGTSSAAAVITATGTTSSADVDRCEVGYVRLRVTTPGAATSLLPPRRYPQLRTR